MITRKVRGRDVTMSEDEWLDRASQVTAADSYLEEARETLKAAREIKAGRAAPTDQHPIERQARMTMNWILRSRRRHSTPRDVVCETLWRDPVRDVDEAADLLGKAIQREARRKPRLARCSGIRPRPEAIPEGPEGLRHSPPRACRRRGCSNADRTSHVHPLPET